MPLIAVDTHSSFVRAHYLQTHYHRTKPDDIPRSETMLRCQWLAVNHREVAAAKATMFMHHAGPQESDWIRESYVLGIQTIFLKWCTLSVFLVFPIDYPYYPSAHGPGVTR